MSLASAKIAERSNKALNHSKPTLDRSSTYSVEFSGRSSLPDIPLTPRERQILEQTSQTVVSSLTFHPHVNVVAWFKIKWTKLASDKMCWYIIEYANLLTKVKLIEWLIVIYVIFCHIYYISILTNSERNCILDCSASCVLFDYILPIDGMSTLVSKHQC